MKKTKKKPKDENIYGLPYYIGRPYNRLYISETVQNRHNYNGTLIENYVSYQKGHFTCLKAF